VKPYSINTNKPAAAPKRSANTIMLDDLPDDIEEEKEAAGDSDEQEPHSKKDKSHKKKDKKHKKDKKSKKHKKDKKSKKGGDDDDV
jgi:hypothetical protein